GHHGSPFPTPPTHPEAPPGAALDSLPHGVPATGSNTEQRPHHHSVPPRRHHHPPPKLLPQELPVDCTAPLTFSLGAATAQQRSATALLLPCFTQTPPRASLLSTAAPTPPPGATPLQGG
ncbi:unnamed protein product, partial [Bubo scandiacus]